MPTINKLPLLDTISGGDQLPVYSPNAGDARRMSINSLADYMQDVITPDNAANITYDPAGTGAVARTVQAKLRETLSVLDFGAVGDGVTDDTAAIQAAINAAAFGQIVLFPANKQYLTKAPLTLKGSVILMGEGTDNTKPQYSHYAQILSMHNGATFVFEGFGLPKAYQEEGVRFVNLKLRSDRSTYPQCIGILASHTSGTVADGLSLVSYNKCFSLTTTYGFVIYNTRMRSSNYGVFVDCLNSDVPITDGIYQTNVLQIQNSVITTEVGTGIYFRGPANVLNIQNSVIESNNKGIELTSYSGTPPAGALDINQPLENVNIQNCYFEDNDNGHVILGLADGSASVKDVFIVGNNINTNGALTEAVKLNCVVNGVFNNTFRYFPTTNIAYLVTVHNKNIALHLDDTDIYNGAFPVAATNNCRVYFSDPSDKVTSPIYVQPGAVGALTGNDVTRYYAGNSANPLASLNDAINFINFFSENYEASNLDVATIYLKNSGSAGTLTSRPIGVDRLIIAADPTSTTTPEIAGLTVVGPFSVSITGPINLLKHPFGASFLPNYLVDYGATLTIDNCSFNFVSPAAGAQFCKAANGATVVLTSTVTSIGDTPTYGVSANRGVVYRGGSTIAGSSGDQVVDGLIVPSQTGSATYDPPSIAAGGQATTTVTITGVVLGDTVTASFSNSLGGLTLSAYVSSANTVTCVFFNPTAGAIDLASGTLRAKVVY